MPKRRVGRHEVIQPLDQSYRLIPLTQGQNAIVDTSDFAWLNQRKWYAQWNKFIKGFYAVSGSPRLAMHRIILDCNSSEIGDHINRNPLDNRRSNLRKVSPSESARNRSRKPKSSSYRGVFRSKWQASITVKDKSIYLGSFDSAEEAARAYDEAAKKYFGAFAQLNFP